MEFIPVEVLRIILLKLTARDLIKLSMVCRRLRKAILEDIPDSTYEFMLIEEKKKLRRFDFDVIYC